MQAEKEVRDMIQRIFSVKGKQTVDTLHRKLGRIMWDHVGMGRNREGLKKAIGLLADLRKEFWKEVYVPGGNNELNNELQKATRLADFIELGELMARDALMREESCGGHFREEYQTPDGEALRDDDKFAFVAAWEYKGPDAEPVLHKEELDFEFVEVKQRSYK
jgi:succinate dehydrogenase / fumarate reductase flavoprotein subunit